MVAFAPIHPKSLVRSILATHLLLGMACSSSPPPCDPSPCDVIEKEIVSNLPAGRSANGICVTNTPPNFVQACADYAKCMAENHCQ